MANRYSASIFGAAYLLIVSLMIKAEDKSTYMSSAEKESVVVEPDNKKVALADLRWQYRVLLVNVSQVDDVNDLIARINNQHEKIQERKLRILLYDASYTARDELHTKESGQNETSRLQSSKAKVMEVDIQSLSGDGTHQDQALVFDINEIEKRLQSKASVLIGLDGGSKSFYDWPSKTYDMDLMDVFADIDGMPMRRSELNRSP